VYYFAYASNLSRKQMLERCPGSKPCFVATLPNYRLVFAGWSRQWRGGYGALKSFRGGRVLGAVYEIPEIGLNRLDKYEPGYKRLKVTVFTEGGEPVEAITYIKSGQLEETSPSKEYLAVIQQGYRDWELTEV